MWVPVSTSPATTLAYLVYMHTSAYLIPRRAVIPNNCTSWQRVATWVHIWVWVIHMKSKLYIYIGPTRFSLRVKHHLWIYLLSSALMPELQHACSLVACSESPYTHAQLSPLYLLSTFGAFHMTKNTRLSTPAQLQCLRSGAWEPGNEAIYHLSSALMPELQRACSLVAWY